MKKEKVGARIRALRESRGETQKDLSKVIGVTPMAISLYESGLRMPSDEIKIAIAHHYDEPIDKIFFAE